MNQRYSRDLGWTSQVRRQRSFKKYEEHDRREETARRERDAGLREHGDLQGFVVKLHGLVDDSSP